MYFYAEFFRIVPRILPTNFTPQWIAGFKDGVAESNDYGLYFTDDFDI